MRSVVTISICLALIICASSPVLAEKETEVIALVNAAIQAFADKGTDHALKLINSPSSPFRKREIYVYAMSLDGVMLAHPANRDLVGKSQESFVDAKGTHINPVLREAMRKDGEGWAEYWWMRHGEKDPTLKRTYVKKVPGENIFVAAGYYVTK
jgi:cytochrome c